MIKLSLWKGENAIGQTVELLADRASFFNRKGIVIVFVVMQYMPQTLLDWICDNNVRILSWFGHPDMRLEIPMELIDAITSYSGEIPMYVPKKY